MCGRYGEFSSFDTLQDFFDIDVVACEVTPNYNVAPTHPVLSIIRQGNENRLDRLYWGLVPFWAKDKSIGPRMINARIETVTKKASFREAFKKRRCLIIADGFYEWKGAPGHKQPMFITLPSKEPFAFAGLWEKWNPKESDEVYRSCAIITTDASESVREIHDRMPAILHPDAYKAWLDPENQNAESVQAILKDCLVGELVSYPVSRMVNSVKNIGPACIEPIG
jgi:putative SOS response-associated peptidase YedK